MLSVLGASLQQAFMLPAATSAVASSVYGLIQTHPDAPDRPLVDFDIALTFIPALLLGVSFGAQTAACVHASSLRSSGGFFMLLQA